MNMLLKLFAIYYWSSKNLFFLNKQKTESFNIENEWSQPSRLWTVGPVDDRSRLSNITGPAYFSKFVLHQYNAWINQSLSNPNSTPELLYLAINISSTTIAVQVPIPEIFAITVEILSVSISVYSLLSLLPSLSSLFNQRNGGGT